MLCAQHLFYPFRLSSFQPLFAAAPGSSEFVFEIPLAFSLLPPLAAYTPRSFVFQLIEPIPLSPTPYGIALTALSSRAQPPSQPESSSFLHHRVSFSLLLSAFDAALSILTPPSLGPFAS
jgi:hypothetical protein